MHCCLLCVLLLRHWVKTKQTKTDFAHVEAQVRALVVGQSQVRWKGACQGQQVKRAAPLVEFGVYLRPMGLAAMKTLLGVQHAHDFAMVSLVFARIEEAK